MDEWMNGGEKKAKEKRIVQESAHVYQHASRDI